MSYESFLEANPIYGEIIPYSQAELDKLAGDIPKDLFEFMKTFGRCSFKSGLLTTVNPSEIDCNSVFKAWGFAEGDYYIFLKTCFGVCIYHYRGNYYYLDPQEGVFSKMGRSLEILLNGSLTLDLFVVDLFRYNEYIIKKDNLPGLKNLEIYMLVPALPIGGSYESSEFVPGNMFEHLCFLAQLFHGQADEY